MGETTGISWCDHTFNPWIGCTKVSAGCANCYAEALMDKRWGRAKWGDAGTRVRTSQKNWDDVLLWDRKAAKEGVRRRVFCASLADVFEDREELTPWRAELFALIERTPNLDWMLLTKRPENVMRMVSESWRKAFPSNVWMGASVENQPAADERVPALLGIPARVRFLSCEPLLGSIDRGREQGFHQSSRWGLSWIEEPDDDKDGVIDALRGENWIEEWWDAEGKDRRIKVTSKGPRIHLVIVGGESGKNARPMHPAWARSIRDQCKAAGVAFFFKQWGEWRPSGDFPEPGSHGIFENGHYATAGALMGASDPASVAERDKCEGLGPYTIIRRIGTKAAGHLLDGKEHHEFPNAASAATPDQKPKEEA